MVNFFPDANPRQEKVSEYGEALNVRDVSGFPENSPAARMVEDRVNDLEQGRMVHFDRFVCQSDGDDEPEFVCQGMYAGLMHVQNKKVAVHDTVIEITGADIMRMARSSDSSVRKKNIMQQDLKIEERQGKDVMVL